jgi:hypothetical protein
MRQQAKTETRDSQFGQALQGLMGRNVVLDTQGTILYLGKLVEVRETGLWLEDADVHDCTEGHASKELYLIEAAHYGIRVNRRRVFVLRSSVLSTSAIEDIVTDISDDRELWSPPAE